MGKKSKKRVANENSEETSKTEVTGEPGQNNALESETSTSTDHQNKQKSHKSIKRRQENDKLNTDSGSTVPDQHINTITEEKNKKRKKHGLVQETPLKVTPSCPAEESAGNSSPPAEQKQNKKKLITNKLGDLEANFDAKDQLPLQNPKTLAKGSSKKNKKIIFEDDGMPIEVASHTSKSNKNKQNFNSDEDEVRDEDIDQFCEDIPEEDNAQFDDWVKLIEAKLGPNKI